jgi:hypothetical protein
MSGDARPEVCLKAVEVDARSMMLRYIKDSIFTSGRLNDVVGYNDPGVESFLAFLSDGQVHGARSTQQYWEKTAESGSPGSQILRLTCGVKLVIPKAELAKQMREATVAPTGSVAIRAKLHKIQGGFFDDLPGQPK